MPAALRESILQRLAKSPADPRQLAADHGLPARTAGGAVRELLAERAVRTSPDGSLALSGGPDNPDPVK